MIEKKHSAVYSAVDSPDSPVDWLIIHQLIHQLINKLLKTSWFILTTHTSGGTAARCRVVTKELATGDEPAPGGAAAAMVGGYQWCLVVGGGWD